MKSVPIGTISQVHYVLGSFSLIFSNMMNLQNVQAKNDRNNFYRNDRFFETDSQDSFEKANFSSWNFIPLNIVDTSYYTKRTPGRWRNGFH